MPTISTFNVVLTLSIVLLLARPAHAFGAGNIASVAKIEGSNCKYPLNHLSFPFQQSSQDTKIPLEPSLDLYFRNVILTSQLTALQGVMAISKIPSSRWLCPGLLVERNGTK